MDSRQVNSCKAALGRVRRVTSLFVNGVGMVLPLIFFIVSPSRDILASLTKADCMVKSEAFLYGNKGRSLGWLSIGEALADFDEMFRISLRSYRQRRSFVSCSSENDGVALLEHMLLLPSRKLSGASKLAQESMPSRQQGFIVGLEKRVRKDFEKNFQGLFSFYSLDVVDDEYSDYGVKILVSAVLGGKEESFEGSLRQRIIPMHGERFKIIIDYVQAPRNKGFGKKVLDANLKLLRELSQSSHSRVELEAASGQGGIVGTIGRLVGRPPGLCGAYVWSKYPFKFEGRSCEELKMMLTRYLRFRYPHISVERLECWTRDQVLESPSDFAALQNPKFQVEETSRGLFGVLRKLYQGLLSIVSFRSLLCRIFYLRNSYELGKSFLLDPTVQAVWYGFIPVTCGEGSAVDQHREKPVQSL